MNWKKTKYDAIVIGSGATGEIAAKCFTDGGANVLVLEAGPELSPEAWGEKKKSQEEFETIKSRQPVRSCSLLYNKKCHLLELLGIIARRLLSLLGSRSFCSKK